VHPHTAIRLLRGDIQRFKDESFDAYKIEEIVDLILEIFFKGVESE